MPVYQIGYGTCEESEYWELEHDDIFSKEELQQIVEDCLFEVMELEAGRFGESGHHKGLFVSDDGPSFQHLMGERSFMCLLAERGFRKVDYETSCSVFGWASAVKPGDWSSHAGDPTRDMQDNLKARIDRAGIYVEGFQTKKKGSTYHRLNRRAE
jgi:hypothetical protein